MSLGNVDPPPQFTILDCTPIVGEYTLDLGSQPGFQEFVKQLGDGLSGNGMVYVLNHEIPSKIIDDVLGQSKEFFELDAETKIKYKKMDPAKDFHGYTAPTGEEIANESDQSVRDFKESFSFVSREICGTNYPNEIPKLRQSILDFHSSMTNFGKKILLALGHYLELDDPEFFVKKHKSLDDLLNPDVRPWIDIRSNYYLALNDDIISGLPDDALRLTEHSDWGTVAFLAQDQDGLEAKVENVGWVPVPPIEGSIVLNSGLMLEMWSGGHFPATAHRVRLHKDRAKEVRQSLAWFLAPDGETKCQMIVNKKEGWKWTHAYPEPLEQTATDYFEDRIKGMYASLYKY